MKNLGRAYFYVALSLLVIGMMQGFRMGATNSLQYCDVHLALLLPGFDTLAIYGVTYRLWPQLEAARLGCNSGWRRSGCCC